jgi:WD40 repeat protein
MPKYCSECGAKLSTKDRDSCPECGYVFDTQARISIGDIEASKHSHVTVAGRDVHQTIIQPPKPQLPPPFMAEKPPDNFVLRPEETNQILDELLAERDAEPPSHVGITTALRGAGGFGKTTLAQYICHLEKVQESFPDGILWVTLGQDANVLGGLLKLYVELTDKRPGFIDIEDASNALKNALVNKRCLIVVDDLWNQAHIKPFLRAGEHCTWLITTRNSDTLPARTRKVDVDAMQYSEAVELLGAGLPIGGYEQPLQVLAARLGEWPLLLKLVNSVFCYRVQEYDQPLSAALEHIRTTLDNRGLIAFDTRDAESRDQAVAITVELSLDRLTASERERYEELAIFPEDIDIPLETVSRLWMYTGQLDAFESETLCGRLHSLALLLRFDLNEKSIRLHDVMRHYIEEANRIKLPDLHKCFIAAYQDSLPTQPAGEPIPWHAGPDDGYFFQYMLNHMHQAGYLEELKMLLRNFNWLQVKLNNTDVSALINDYDYLDLSSERLQSFALIQSALQLSAHVLSQDKTQLAAQLLGRMMNFKNDGIQTLLKNAFRNQGESWLRPLTASLEPPGGPMLRTLRGHTEGIVTVAVTPDGQHVISGSRDKTVKVWEFISGREVYTLSGHEARVSSVSVTPDGKYIFSGSWDNTIKMWDLAKGLEIPTLIGHPEGITSLAVTPNGKYVVSGSADNTLKVWEAANGREVYALKGHEARVTAVSVSPDGQYIISGSWDNTIKVWEVQSGLDVRTLEGHSDGISSLAVTPNGKYIISGSRDNTIKVWDIYTGQEVRTLLGNESRVIAIAVTPDGQHIISGARDNTIKVWEIDSGREIRTLKGHTNWVWALAVTPDGQHIISGAWDHTLKVWDMTNDFKVPTKKGHTKWVSAVAVTPDGQFVVSGSGDSTLKVWDLVDRRELHELKGHKSRIISMALTPDGQCIVSGSRDNTLKVWEATSGQEVLTLKGHTSPISKVVITPDGQHIISGSVDETLIVWKMSDGQAVHILEGHTSPISAVAVTPNGQHIISGSGDKTMKVWDITSGHEVCTLKGHESRISAVAVTSDGQFIISGSWDNTLKIWEIPSGIEWNIREIYTLKGHTDDVISLAVTHDRQYIISGSDDHTLKVWEMVSGRDVSTLVGHFGDVNSVAVTPNGKYIISGSWDHTLKVWNIKSGKCLANFHTEGPTLAFVVTPDGKTVVAGDASGRVHFLRLEGL